MINKLINERFQTSNFQVICHLLSPKPKIIIKFESNDYFMEGQIFGRVEIEQVQIVRVLGKLKLWFIEFLSLIVLNYHNLWRKVYPMHISNK